jgi:hypothetical protein
MLNEVNFGFNKFCGPSVLSALTGESTDRCAAVISNVTGRQVIKGVTAGELKKTLLKLRFSCIDAELGGYSLYRALWMLKEKNGKYVVFVPKHVVAVEVKDNEIHICDNHTKTPLDIKQSARLTQKVDLVYQVERLSAPRFLCSNIVVEKNYSSYTIREYGYYELPDDDTSTHIGSIYCDKEKLYKIMEALSEFTKNN